MTMLTSDRIRGTDDALAFLTECTLATVEGLAGRARPPKHELSRQISIAQTGITHLGGIVQPGVNRGCPRVQDVIESGLSVEDWIKGKQEAWSRLASAKT